MKPLLRITGARIVTLDDDAPDPLDATDLWIADGRIAALLSAGSPPPADGPVETLTLSNALVLPGLVNAHTHSASALLRGTNPGLPVDLYCLEATTRRTPRMEGEIRVCVHLQATEMLKRGVTSVVDHFRYGAVPSAEAISQVFSAYAETGMRVAIAPMFDDKLYVDSLPLQRTQLPAPVRERWDAMRAPSADDYFAAMEEIVTEWRSHDRFKVLLGVEGPPRGTPRAFELAGAFAARHGIGLHTHLLEAKTQALMAPADCGGSFVAYLDRFGLVNPKSSLAHFIWCNERDIALCAERQVNVVHNPVSNLLYGSGLQPTARMMEAGVNVALGSDGAGGNHISLFEQAKFAMLLSRISQADCERWITAPQALRMASRNGGAVLGEPDMIGVIRPGARADLVVIDMSSQAYRPLGDLWTHLVMYETGAGVDTVIVGGEIVVRHGRCTWVNEAELLAEADAMAAKTKAASTTNLAVAHAERAAFQPLIIEALQKDATLDRFAHLS
jgi:5-methylthioadenosine/S-adenosylhomocysteine deaminase